MSKKGPWVLFEGELWTRAELDAHRYHEAQKVRSRVVPEIVKPKRGRYLFRDGEEIDVTDGYAPVKRDRTSGPQIVRDIQEYRGVGFRGAPMVTSRSQHRELLRREGKVEVGNEKEAFLNNPNKPKLRPVEHDLLRAFAEHGWH